MCLLHRKNAKQRCSYTKVSLAHALSSEQSMRRSEPFGCEIVSKAREWLLIVKGSMVNTGSDLTSSTVEARAARMLFPFDFSLRCPCLPFKHSRLKISSTVLSTIQVSIPGAAPVEGALATCTSLHNAIAITSRVKKRIEWSTKQRM